MDLPERSDGEHLELPGSFTELAFKSQKSHVASPKSEEETARDFPLLLTHLISGLRSFMISPLISGDRAIGTVHFQSVHSDAYTEEDIRISESISTQIAGTLANAKS